MGIPSYTAVMLVLTIVIPISSALPEYRHVGCFNDRRQQRAMGVHLGNYGSQSNPQFSCWLAAKSYGWTAFALQNAGECWSGPDAHLYYGIHGQSGGCRDNLGGGWANDVYIKAYYHVGCFKDNWHRSLVQYLGTFSEADSAQKCYEKTVAKGYHAYGIQNGGECWSSVSADSKYNLYGPAMNCKGGKGGGWAHDIYFLHNYSPLYKSHGCYKDKSSRAMGSHQGTRSNRNDSIEMCYKDAIKNGFTMFGLQHNGECWSGKDIVATYSKYGATGNCKNGLGGGWANDVYSINYHHKGCYKESTPKAMSELLGTFRSSNAVSMCYELVKMKNYDTFGLQKSGECYASSDGRKTYDKYGAGSDCRHGTGAPHSNDVYFINDFDSNSKMYPKEGCFKDSRDRALPEYLGYFKRDAVNRCFQAVLAKDWRYFGVQNNGECWSGPNSAATYSKHGVGTGCYQGLGGQWSNDVYRIAFQHKGCFHDDPLRALPDVIGKWPGGHPSVQKAICFAAVKAKGLKVFGIQYDGECYSSQTGVSTYQKYGKGTGCKDGVGASWNNDVYYVNSTSQYTSLGCWKDEAWRRFKLLGTWREDSYLKCYEATMGAGLKGFGVQYGGECWSSPEIETRYNERGKSDKCKDGKGTDWTNDIYLI